MGVYEQRGAVYFVANARETGEDPYYQHLYRVNLNGAGLTLLNRGDFDHRVSMGESNRFFVDNYSRVNTTPAVALYGAGGRKILDLEEADFTKLLEAGYAMADVRHIVLTHAHGDHVGGAAELVRRSGAEVIAHRLEVPYIEQRRPLPARRVLNRTLNRLSAVAMKSEPASVDRSVVDGDTVEALGGLQVVHTPGHTPGSICLHQAERGILLCGDALFNANPVTGRPGLRLPPRMICSDNDQARASVEAVLALKFDVLCAGHGEPILTGAREAIRELLL